LEYLLHLNSILNPQEKIPAENAPPRRANILCFSGDLPGILQKLNIRNRSNHPARLIIHRWSEWRRWKKPPTHFAEGFSMVSDFL